MHYWRTHEETKHLIEMSNSFTNDGSKFQDTFSDLLPISQTTISKIELQIYELGQIRQLNKKKLEIMLEFEENSHTSIPNFILEEGVCDNSFQNSI